jgi:teichoic acid transport system ATP-binding protein
MGTDGHACDEWSVDRVRCLVLRTTDCGLHVFPARRGKVRVVNRPPVVIAKDVHVSYHVMEDRSAGLKQRFASGRRGSGRARVVRAVRGVSFELFESESLGLIGSNGSGKSTLLAALTGLLPVQQGAIRVRSRPTLLGVGAALRPALSGRRNIVLGSLALGNNAREARASVDDIIDFSGLRESIDLPMNTYSSGMRARLTFAIATAVVPDILLIDEALAVGDVRFRHRSRERIDDILAAAGAVILVSHNLSEIESSCDRVLWLEKGVVRADGEPADVISEYLDDQGNAERRDAADQPTST